jgi:hypothetical protein
MVEITSKKVQSTRKTLAFSQSISGCHLREGESRTHTTEHERRAEEEGLPRFAPN